MKTLSQMKSLRLYKAKTNSISGIDLNMKNPKKESAILFIGSSPKALPTFMKNGWFRKQYFSSVYREHIFRTPNSKAHYNRPVNKIYTDLTQDELGYKVFTKPDLKGYAQRNVVFDITEPFALTLSTSGSKNNTSLSDLASDLIVNSINRLKEEGYTKITIVSDVYITKETSSKYVSKLSDNSTFANLAAYTLRTGSDLWSKLSAAEAIMLYNQDGSFFKVGIDELSNMGKKLSPKYRTILSKLLSGALPDKEDVMDGDEEIQKPYNQSTITSGSFTATNLTSAEKNAQTSVGVAEVKATKTEIRSDKIDDVLALTDKIGISMDSYGNRVSGDLDVQFREIIEKEIKADPTLLKTSADGIYNTLKSKPEVNAILKSYIATAQLGKSAPMDKKYIDSLKSKQNKLFADKGIDELLKEKEDRTITLKTIKNADTIFEEISTESKIKAFDDSYMEKQYDKDIIDMFKAFNDTDLGLYLTKFNVDHIDDDMDRKDRYHVTYKNFQGDSSSFTVDIPTIIDSRYVFLQGSKKIISKQLISRPVVKVKSDQVFITSNYNKLEITRFGQKLTEFDSIIRKIATDKDLNKKTNGKIAVVLGDASTSNGTRVSLLYNQLASFLFSLRIDKLSLYFSQSNLSKQVRLEEFADTTYDKSIYYPVGFDGQDLVVEDRISGDLFSLNKSSKLTPLAKNLNMLISERIEKNSDYKVGSNSGKTNPSLAYTRMKILNRQLPMIAVIGSEFGITAVLEQSGVDYQFVEKNVRLSLLDERSKIKFNDGYLLYNSSDIRTSLLLSGLRELDTEEYNFAEFNSVEPYINYFGTATGNPNLAKGIHNQFQLFIDPITLDVLQQLNYPTDMLSLLLLANDMLGEGSYSSKNDMSTYRVRTSEQVPAVLYKELATAAQRSLDGLSRRTPTPFSVSLGAVINTLMGLQTVESASELNPSLTADKIAKVSYKGLNGMNNDQTYNLDIRNFSESMKGIMASSTPDSAKVGAVRYLSRNANINGTRGFLAADQPENKNTSLISTVEMITPFAATHDDPPRNSMNSAQQKHLLPVKGASKPLYGTGMERTIYDDIPDIFTITAKQNGKVESYDEDNNIVILRYNDGTSDVIDMDTPIFNNSEGGFYQKLEYELMFKPGKKFKEGDIIARNPQYFHGDEQGEISYSVGHLTPIAIMGFDGTLTITSGWVYSSKEIL